MVVGETKDEAAIDSVQLDGAIGGKQRYVADLESRNSTPRRMDNAEENDAACHHHRHYFLLYRLSPLDDAEKLHKYQQYCKNVMLTSSKSTEAKG